jgi:demethylmenaquinone methyltransferase / 2-methoxy-6-polyprenyl-1,4-benzoquinol methylase
MTTNPTQPDPAKKKDEVRRMFNDISGRYDFLNHFLSFRTDYRWRKKLVGMLSPSEHRRILDVATGTADLAIAIASLGPEKITGIDIAENMLRVGRIKVAGKGLSGIIGLLAADSEALPFSDDSFDAVTVAFGVRNFGRLQVGLEEMRRVLRPGGIALILEFSQPTSVLFRKLYGFYSRWIIPAAGRIISGNCHAYSYLPESVSAFPSGEDFLAIMKAAGFRNTGRIPLTFGIATIYSGYKQTGQGIS